MTAEEYSNYRASDTWKEKCKQRLEIDNYQCACCGASAAVTRLEIHHFSYHDIGREDVWKQLVALCPTCHLAVHRIMARKTSPTRRGWKDTLPAGVTASLKEHGLA